METALYGPDGFYVRPGPGPAAHFRTSAHASPQFAEAILRLLERVDHALDRPDPLDLVDVGAGRGELLAAVSAAAPPELAARLRPVAVERTPVANSVADWRDSIPERIQGLLVATEWLDNLPLDVAQLDEAGVARYVLVDPATGDESLGEPVTRADSEWLARWWPLGQLGEGRRAGSAPAVPGTRAELGGSRDRAWAAAVAGLHRGLALAVDYGHQADSRPPLGTLTGFREGYEVAPVPDGSCDLTAHVTLDSVAAAGAVALRTGPHPRPESEPARPAGRAVVCGATEPTDLPGPAGWVLLRQAEAVRGLGVHGGRPPLALAHRDPGGYLRRLAAASAAAELTDPAGLGGHYWLLQPVGIADDVAGWLA